MSIVSWVGSGFAIIVAGLCWLLLRHLSHLPSNAHPWLYRLAIIGMYSAGVAFVFTAAGRWIIAHIESAFGLIGASTSPGSGLGWALVTLSAFFIAAAVLVALIWTPSASAAYLALAAPLVLVLAPAGFAHQLFTMTSAPAMSLVTQIATWAGG